MAQSKTAPANVGSVSNKVVQKVAEAKDVDPLELTPPLYEIIDSDALNRLFASGPPAGGGEAKVIFSYNECEVTVSSDGSVSIQ